MRYKNIEELTESLKNVVEIRDGQVRVTHEAAARGALLDRLLFNAIFNADAEISGKARWLIKAVAYELGVRSAPIQGL